MRPIRELRWYRGGDPSLGRITPVAFRCKERGSIRGQIQGRGGDARSTRDDEVHTYD